MKISEKSCIFLFIFETKFTKEIRFKIRCKHSIDLSIRLCNIFLMALNLLFGTSLDNYSALLQNIKRNLLQIDKIEFHRLKIEIYLILNGNYGFELNRKNIFLWIYP